jgi:hypothetical protein
VAKSAETVKSATAKQAEVTKATATSATQAATAAVNKAVEQAPKAPEIIAPVTAEMVTPVSKVEVSLDDSAANDTVKVTQKVEAEIPVPLVPVSQLFEAWQSDDVVKMITSAQEAANEAFASLVDAVSDQTDLYSDAGSHFTSQYEDLFQSHFSNWDGMMQASSKMVETGGLLSKEWMAWMQRELDAAQSDVEALSKVEKIEDVQEVNSRIVKRMVDGALEEHFRIQEIWLGMWNDGVSLIGKSWENKAAG